MNKTVKKRLVVVLGMHRSGTSAITRGLKVMGVELGDNLMPAIPGNNDKGFWEDLDFYALNTEILSSFGYDWDAVVTPARETLGSDGMLSLRERAIALLAEKIIDTPIFGVKDPRLCTLLPFWKKVFDSLGLQVSYVVVVRNPMCVARSLRLRDSIEYEKSYYLWMQHMVTGMLASEDCDRVVIDYDLLIEQPEVQLKRLASQLELKLDSDSADELNDYKDNFLDSKLRHTNFSLEDLKNDPAAPSQSIDTYSMLLRVAKDELSENSPDVSGLFSKMELYMQDIRPALQYMTTIDKDILQIGNRLTEREEQIAGLKELVAYREEQIAGLKELVANRDVQISNLNRQKAGHGERVAGLNEVLSERDAQIADLIHTLTEREGRITALSNELAQKSEWALQLDAELKAMHSQLIAMKQSYSWRIASPLREARRWVTAPRQQAKHYMTLSLRKTRSLYQSLPLSYSTKAAHRNILAKYMPGVLLGSGSHPATLPMITVPDIQQSAPDKNEAIDEHAGAIQIPASNKPKISVIIPVFGEIDYTLRCLMSISEHLTQAPFEVIVIDDCSPDNSAEMLAQVTGIRLISNQKNQGFIRSCNRGAGIAAGDYLLFLNNDTVVTTGWLDELLRTFREFPGTGLAGSKLIYPDGRLQEAGGIIWQDGSAWNFGRLQDPYLPVFNYAREVDYCSGASVMVPRALFEEIGGFDEHYLPAYCEDSDLALKIRSKGHRVIYQPLSAVIHYEGITSGTDTSQGTKAFQIENTKKLYKRWEDYLGSLQPAGEEVDKAKDRRATRRALVVDHCTPTPNQDAGSVTVFNLMLLLREMDFQVTFVPEDNFLFMPEYTTALQRAGIEVIYAPYVTHMEQHLKECGDRYDLALLFRPAVVERQISNIRKYCTNARVLFHTVDLHYLRMSREAELQSDKAKQKIADEMKQRELAAIRSSDASIVHSTAELELLQPELPDARIHVFPLILDVQGTAKSFFERKNVVFVGGFQHTPNVDAVHYFVAEIMPLLRQRLPGVRFYAVGSKPPEEIMALACEDIYITGFVDDLAPLLDQMRVSVAPLRYGAGIKGKIGSAMAAGLPVVATSLAAEGMSLTDGENILVADGVDQYADAIVRLYEDKALWSRISANGLEFAENAWGANMAWKILSTILSDLSITTTRNAYPLSLFSGTARKQQESSPSGRLKPLASVQNREQLYSFLESDSLDSIRSAEKSLLDAASAEVFSVDGFCVPCNKNVSFLVDMQSGGQRLGNGWLPNWRERLVCPSCGMNNRQRLIATLIKQQLDEPQHKHVYFMEQVTPIYHWATAKFRKHVIFGSEYLGHEYEGGSTVKGIRHEDIENLSFEDNSLDLIVSNDVFEHVPDPAVAYTECARVLKPGGVLLATIPFHSDHDLSVTRAKLIEGKLEHILPPSYHGNPISSDGSLVFTDFGWDILKDMQVAGISNPRVEVYASADLGHLGGGQIVFRGSKDLNDEIVINSQCEDVSDVETVEEKPSSLIAIMGEVLWHSLTIDPTIEEVSKQHYKTIKSIIKKNYRKPRSKRPMRFLEVAAYAHTTGYMLAKESGAEVVLTDISADTLALGKKVAEENLKPDARVMRVTADFHELPFADGQFDMVYISSALHHTWSWQTVLNEMIRVTAPGGLLYLDNEPCLRELCFYKFRTNRPAQFRELEQCIKQDDLILTIAEPYLGSRQEQLFGMVENQTMPLDEILGILMEAGSIEHKSLVPELCMGEFERKIVGLRSEGKERIREFIETELKTGVHKANSILGTGDLALGYSLPTGSEIEDMADRISARVAALNGKESSDDFRMELSRLFGAGISVLVCKDGELPDTLRPLELRYEWGVRNDVVIGYPESIENVLNRIEDVLPNIQSTPEMVLQDVYPSADWNMATADNGIRTLTPLVNGSRIICRPVPEARRLQILMRVYAHYDNSPYRIHLSLNGNELATFDVHQIDSFLFSPEAEMQNGSFELTMTTTSVETGESVPASISISAARVCAIH